MRVHKADKDMPYCELHDHYQTIFVSTDIENVVLVAYIVGCRKVHLDVREVSPLCLFSRVIPAFKCCLGVTVTFRTIKLYQSSV